VVHQVGLQLVLVVHDNGDILMVSSYLQFWMFVFSFSLQIFLISEKNIWFGLGGLLLVLKGFCKAARVAFSKYLYDKPWPKFLDSKTVLIYGLHSFSFAFS
jgi:hypothetical protein